MIGLGKLKCFAQVLLCCALIPMANAAETPANLQCDVVNSKGDDETYIIKVYLSTKKIGYKGEVYSQEETKIISDGEYLAIDKIFVWDDHEITWGRIVRKDSKQWYPEHWTLNRLSGVITSAYISDHENELKYKGKCRKVDIVESVI